MNSRGVGKMVTRNMEFLQQCCRDLIQLQKIAIGQLDDDNDRANLDNGETTPAVPALPATACPFSPTFAERGQQTTFNLIRDSEIEFRMRGTEWRRRSNK